MNQSLFSLLSHLNSKLSQSGCAIDVGAHHGEFSKFLISTGFFSKILAFEPNLESFNITKDKVLSINNCEFEVVNFALSSKLNSMPLYFDLDTSTASLLKYVNNYVNEGGVRSDLVSVKTLDDYLIADDLFHGCKFLKVDTQGHDLDVIKGGYRIISQYRPIIQVEFIYIPLYEGQCSPAELTSHLNELGYKIYSQNNLHVNPEGRLCFCDAIFVPEEYQISITQEFRCIDDEASFRSQLEKLGDICEERLNVINILDAELRRLREANQKYNCVKNFYSRLKSWVQ